MEAHILHGICLQVLFMLITMLGCILAMLLVVHPQLPMFLAIISLVHLLLYLRLQSVLELLLIQSLPAEGTPRSLGQFPARHLAMRQARLPMVAGVEAGQLQEAISQVFL